MKVELFLVLTEANLDQHCAVQERQIQVSRNPIHPIVLFAERVSMLTGAD